MTLFIKKLRAEIMNVLYVVIRKRDLIQAQDVNDKVRQVPE
jgi:hypothetical protein